MDKVINLRVPQQVEERTFFVGRKIINMSRQSVYCHIISMFQDQMWIQRLVTLRFFVGFLISLQDSTQTVRKLSHARFLLDLPLNHLIIRRYTNRASDVVFK
jgi:hypothetical protein